jgi:transcriptional regulator with XRE-family HTH domain|tara:strand:+ start:91 stop:360 length:270 start_codon:yes stop_codon:yes gene_type:complete
MHAVKTEPETLGSICRDLRRNAGLTQVQLSAALANVQGFAQAAISRLESDQWLPDAGQMEHFLKVVKATEEDSRNVRQFAAALAVRCGN